MAVEILTVSLSDESIELLARRIVALQNGNQTITPSNPPLAENPQSAEKQSFQPQADPWTNPAPPQSTVPPVVQAQNYPQPPVVQQQQGAAPTCQHGPMRYVPAGFSQNTNRAYAAFWGCPAQRGDPSRCKSVPA